MGGGDLNLKKSWHPSTLRNIERVWKAEQKHEVEKQKIEQLQKELAEERAREEIQTYAEDQGVVKKKDERLDWMYQGPAAMVNREEYLLGRKVDKTFETLQKIENGEGTSKNEDNDIGSTMFSSQNLSGTATVDLANKIREDPLFCIMKKEKEERKSLLTNPVKMKQLQQMLKASLGNQKNKKSKKSKKKKHHESDSDEEKHQKKRRKRKQVETSDSDVEQLLSKETSKDHRSKHRVSGGESYSSERRSSKFEYEEDNSSERRHKSSHYQSDYRESSRRSDYPHDSLSSSNYRNSHSESSHHRNSHSESSHHRNSHSESSHHRNSHSESSHHRNSHSESSNHRNSHSESSHHRNSHSESSNHREYHSSQTHRNTSYDPKPYYHKEDLNSKCDDDRTKKKKLDSSERERLLKEMQENARWRDDQRKRNTQRYKEEDEKEERSHKIDTSDFLKPMLSKAAGKGSLENRVKQKIFTLQRNSADMNKNFARRD